MASVEKIIFSIAVLNEESRIEGVINSIKAFASEIVLLDAGCSDRTIEIARQTYQGIRVVKVGENMFDVPTRMLALKNSFERDISNEWLLPLNASEKMTPELGEYLLKIINRHSYLCGISFYRQSFTFDVKTHNRKFFFLFTGLLGLAPVRLFRFRCWDMHSSKIHKEFPLLPQYTRATKWISPLFYGRYIQHFRFGSIEEFELKHIKYSNQEALELHNKGVKAGYFSLFKMLIPSLIYFPFQFIFSKRAGIVGIYHIVYKFQVWAKLAEYEFRKC